VVVWIEIKTCVSLNGRTESEGWGDYGERCGGYRLLGPLSVSVCSSSVVVKGAC
jgi:hypothetical protein